MNTTQWFREQLRASGDAFVWAVEQLPASRRYASPPEGLGDWSLARHLFHIAFYEQAAGLPTMRQWLGEPCPMVADVDEDEAWQFRQAATVEELLAEFKAVRDEQIALLDVFDEAAWQTTKVTVWGPVTLLWVVSKTFQHTAEVLNDVMRLGLFWSFFEAGEKRDAE